MSSRIDRRTFLSQSLALPALLQAAPNPAPASGDSAEPKTELFLDDEFLEMTASVTRRIHPPTKHRLNPVLRPEQWWEGDCVMPL
ncbi:MAG TPA: hypothetical protein VG672_08685, partial [Bryobacteraceae bacterium]|nr:hypothetical protein [Bryobacteraceae bacterium]